MQKGDRAMSSQQTGDDLCFPHVRGGRCLPAVTEQWLVPLQMGWRDGAVFVPWKSTGSSLSHLLAAGYLAAWLQARRGEHAPFPCSQAWAKTGRGAGHKHSGLCQASIACRAVSQLVGWSC